MIEAEIPFTQHINDVAIVRKCMYRALSAVYAISILQVIEELYKYVVRKLLEQCNDDITLSVKKAGHDDNYKVLAYNWISNLDCHYL